MTLLVITSAGYAFLGLLLFSLWITSRIVKREREKSDGRKSGCLFLYVGAIVFFVGVLAIWISTIFISQMVNNILAITTGHQYTAEVVDWTSEWKSSTDDDGRTTEDLYYTPILQFTTVQGSVLNKEVNYSSTAQPEMGETYTIYYNQSQDYMLVWSYHTFILFFCLLLMGVIFSFIFYGTIRYALGFSMEGYKITCKKFIVQFLVPFSLIGFDLLLIWLLFTNDSLLVGVVLLIFIFILSAAVYGWFLSWAKKRIN